MTLTYQNLLFCRVPTKFILGFIIRIYKKVGSGRSREPKGTLILTTSHAKEGDREDDADGDDDDTFRHLHHC